MGERLTNATTKHCEPLSEGKLKKEVPLPGQEIGSDQCMCMQPGRLCSSKGRLSLSDKFCGGTSFVDLASLCIWLKHQVSLSASDVIQAKILFEQFALNTGVSM